MPHTLTSPASGNPKQVLRYFCSTYSPSQAQRSLWHWFMLAFNGSLPRLNVAHTNQLLAYYEHLEALIVAVYQLQELADEAEAPTNTAEGDDSHA